MQKLNGMFIDLVDNAEYIKKLPSIYSILFPEGYEILPNTTELFELELHIDQFQPISDWRESQKQPIERKKQVFAKTQPVHYEPDRGLFRRGGSELQQC